MPRAGLTPQRVVEEAGAVADATGLDRLTLAAVADRFGVAIPSLYKHVRGLDGLRRALAPDDTEHLAAAADALDVFFSVLAGYGIRGDDAIDAIRGLRAAMHGFVTLEAGGGFGLPQSVDTSYHRLVDALDAALGAWPTADAPTAPEEP